MNTPAAALAAAQHHGPSSRQEDQHLDEVTSRARIGARILRGQGWLRSPYRGVWLDPDAIRRLEGRRGKVADQ